MIGRRFLVGALIAVVMAALATAPAEAAPQRHGGYLALGDSVVFGYRPGAVTPPADYLDASNFKGFPELYGAAKALNVVNASCPGETTASMMTAGAQSNGCENSLGSPEGYRTQFPLHVPYSGTQLDYAVRYLRTHQDTRLVTLTIGANDMFLCQNTTASHCTGTDFQAALDRVGRNVTAIFAALRGAGHYRGTLMVVSYYSLDYRDPVQVAQSKALDAALAGPVKRFHGVVADGLSAFRKASQSAGGDTCAAGLIIALPGGGCDVHPTAAGHRALAAAVARALPDCGRKD
jgi:lysophospholipase L1-like esterase